MNLFKQTPSPAERQAYADEVIASLELSGLNPETTLVLGGSALALAGIRRAHDVDVMIPNSIFHALVRDKYTPTQIRVSDLDDAHLRPFVTLHTSRLKSDALPIDVTVPHNPNKIPDHEIDEVLLRTLASFDRVAGFPFMPPELVIEQKRELKGRGRGPLRRKDLRDARLVEQHLAEHKRHVA